jgi:hypothetical protein
MVVLAYGGIKVKEFVVGEEPTTNFNPVVHNMTEIGVLKSKDINFEMGFMIYNVTANEVISMDKIDKRYIQFDFQTVEEDYTGESY